MTIYLTSLEDTYLYLREGTDRYGRILLANDDHDIPIGGGDVCADIYGLGDFDSCVLSLLEPGSYTIEATTFEGSAKIPAGSDFTLTIEALSVPVTPTPMPTVTGTPAPTQTPMPHPPTSSPTPVPHPPTPPVPPQPTPSPTPQKSSGGFIEVSRGYDHACALGDDGSISCWGANDVGQASPPASGRFTAISSGHKGTCALRDDGAVLCWGSFTVGP